MSDNRYKFAKNDTDAIPVECQSCSVAGCGGKVEDQPGCIHLYCGSAKARKQMSLGAALRAVDEGQKVLMYQFVKTKASVFTTGKEDTLEKILKYIPEITKIPTLPMKRFAFMLDEEEKETIKKANQEKLSELARLAAEYDLIVLDEALYAIEMGILNEGILLEWLKRKPISLEVILTGRKAGEKIQDMAEFVVQIDLVKDTFETGVTSRMGIE